MMKVRVRLRDIERKVQKDMNTTTVTTPDAIGSNVLSVALIGPTESRRKPIASALATLHGSIREYSKYPEIDDVPKLVEPNYDVIVIELDSDPEYALELVESICGSNPVTVMVYSEQMNPDMLVRCMRAGAREFLAQPITATTLAEAMVRASVRKPSRAPAKATGKLLLFAGAKGGSGVTTVATNFAVALAQESKRSTVLIDLNLPLGNAALDIGLTPEYTTANALQNAARLDSNYLSTLLTKHSSGLSVLAAPDKYSSVQATNESVERLLTIARQEFEFVIVDVGSRFDSMTRSLLEAASVVYLVLQVSISELRNANRLITDLFRTSNAKVEVVLNRFTPRALSIDEASITKALTMQPAWKIASDYPAARTAQNTASPLVMQDSSVARVIRQMARSAGGTSETPEKKKRFGLFK
jgi:pilus assembly protein CpaE